MNKLFYPIFLTSILFHSLSSAQAGKVIVQLLADEVDLKQIKTLPLGQENKIPFHHISFLEIDDASNVLHNNDNCMGFFNKLDISLKAAQKNYGQLQIICKGVKSYVAEKTSTTFWCLQDDKENVKNQSFKTMANFVKGTLENFMKEKKAFCPKNINEAAASESAETKKSERSYVEFSKGFPHMSVAKGQVKDSIFSSLNENEVYLKITGYTIIYTYDSQEMDIKIPQIYFQKKINDTEYKITSQFSCISPRNVHMGDFFKNIGGLGSEIIKREIIKIKDLKQLEVKKSELTAHLLEMRKQIAEHEARKEAKRKASSQQGLENNNACSNNTEENLAESENILREQPSKKTQLQN